jgi:hypothetical protein
MMTTLRITRIWIEHIDKIEVEDAKEFDPLEMSKREITISTDNGEKFELILEAHTAEQLEFKKPADWLTPKVYHGKSMHDEEGDHVS